MDLHPAVAHLAPLLGIWRGAGRGDYPTIDPFEYTEEVTIGHVGKPFLAYNQRTKSADGTPMHAECGYWRPAGQRGLELLIVHPSGIAEILVGEVAETHFGLVVTMRAGAGAAETGAGTDDETGIGSGAGVDGTDPDPVTDNDPAGAAGTEGTAESGERVGATGRVILAPTAKRVDATERRISVDGDAMRYEVHMAAVGLPMTHHLEATLHRAG